MHMVHNIKYWVLRVWRGTNIFTIAIDCQSAGGRLRDCG